MGTNILDFGLNLSYWQLVKEGTLQSVRSEASPGGNNLPSTVQIGLRGILLTLSISLINTGSLIWVEVSVSGQDTPRSISLSIMIRCRGEQIVCYDVTVHDDWYFIFHCVLMRELKFHLFQIGEWAAEQRAVTWRDVRGEEGGDWEWKWDGFGRWDLTLTS